MKIYLKAVVAVSAIVVAGACSKQSGGGPVAPTSILSQQSGASSGLFRSLSSSGCFDESNASLTFNGGTATATFTVVNDACVGRTIWLTSYYPDVPFTFLPGGDITEPYPQHRFAEVSIVLVNGLNTVTVAAPECPYVGAQVDLAFQAGTGLLPNGEFYTDANFVLAAVRNNECAAAFNGCTHGYWKNHSGWPAPYTQTTLVSSVFSGPGIPAGYTFQQALEYGGPSKPQILLRNAIASVLDTASSGVNFPLTLSQLQQMVNTALAGSNSDMTTLNGVLDGYNNANCPLN